jgi:hypothetical protein
MRRSAVARDGHAALLAVPLDALLCARRSSHRLTPARLFAATVLRETLAVLGLRPVPPAPVRSATSRLALKRSLFDDDDDDDDDDDNDGDQQLRRQTPPVAVVVDIAPPITPEATPPSSPLNVTTSVRVPASPAAVHGRYTTTTTTTTTFIPIFAT